jgi:hypothetical protein
MGSKRVAVTTAWDGDVLAGEPGRLGVRLRVGRAVLKLEPAVARSLAEALEAAAKRAEEGVDDDMGASVE